MEDLGMASQPQAVWQSGKARASVNSRIVMEGMTREGQKRRYFEKLMKRPGYLSKCGGSREVGGKGNSKIFPWVIIRRGGAFNRE